MRASMAGKYYYSSVLLRSIAIALFFNNPLSVQAGPQGGTVTGGSGSINQSGNQTTINQTSQNMAINWQSYNLNADERVRYIQPNRSSLSLNRILDNSPSQIRGRIDANGQVILVNPNGIFFSPTSVINVSGIIASGLDISTNDFMNGDFVFREVVGTEGIVVNSGIINAATGGYVSLQGKQVKNEGLISARLGKVNLLAANEAVLKFDQQGLIGVEVTREVLQDEIGINPAVLNSGDIQAEGGQVLLTASVSRDIFSRITNVDEARATSVVVHEDGSFTLGGGANVENTGSIDVSRYAENAVQPTEMRIVLIGENINNSGSIKANNHSGNGGEIELHARDTLMLTDSSQVSARSEVNGQGSLIKLLGDKVGLIDQVRVDASGSNGGGKVLIGGDQEGRNDQIRNARFLYLGEQVQVNADGLDNGSGGTVIAFASDTARVYSKLSARGGVNGGNGGFIETSGLWGLDLKGSPDVSAPAGIGGEWLIDPYNITITSSNTNAAIQQPDAFTFEAIATGANVDVFDIYWTLRIDGDVTIKTSALGDTGTEAGNIVWAADLNYNNISNTTANRTLTLQADGNITFLNGSAIRDSSNDNENLSVNLFAKGSVTLGNVDIETRGGDLTIGGIVDTVDYIPTYFEQGNNSAFIDTRGSFSTGDGNVTITTDGANLGVGVHLGEINTGDGDLIVTATGGTITQSSNTARNLTVNGLTNLVAAGRNVTLNNTANNFNRIQFSSANASVYDVDTIRLADASLTGTGNALVVTTNDGDIIQQAGTTITTSGNNANVRLTAGGTGNITQGNNAAIINNGNSSLTTLNAVDNTINLNNNGNDFTRVRATGQSITLRDTNGISLGAMGNNQDNATLTVTTENGSITQTGLINYSGANAQIRLTANGTGSDILQTTNLINNGNNALSDFSATDAITMSNTANNFTRVSVNANTAELVDTNSIVLDTSTITGTGNSMTVTANNGGTITQTGRISNVNGVTRLNTTGNIDLTNTNNDFATVNVDGANTVSLTDANSIDLAAANLNGNLTVNAISGDITQTGTLNISLLTDLTAGNSIILTDANNDFQQAINMNASRASIVNSNNITLGTSTLTGTGNNLTLTARNSGVINQSGAISNANGVTNLTAGTISLDNPNNDFGTVVVSQAESATLVDTNSIDLGTTNVSSSLSVTTGSNINNSGAIVLSDTATASFTVDNGSINLNNSGNRFMLPITLSSTGALSHVSVSNTLASELNVLNTISGDLNITSTGDISATTALTVNGTTSLDAGSGDINLLDPANDFTILNISAANNVDIVDSNSIEIGSINANNVDIQAQQIALGRIDATTTNLTANNGAITDVNGDALNLVGDSATLHATTGVGMGDPLETQLNLLTVSTSSGGLDIHNTGTVTVNLAASDNINFTNTGDVYLDRIDAEAFGDNHNLIEMTIINGSVYSAQPRSTPDIRGHDVSVVVNEGSGDFGEPGSPISIDIHGNFTLLANISNYDLFDSIPANIVDNSSIRLSIGSLFALLSGQKMIEVESLLDIDPAIFTAVRNFYHDDIAILMPADQRFTENDDEEYRRTSVR